MADTIRKDIGAVSAYALAVEGGYTGTEEQYKQDMANLANNVTQVANDKAAAAGSAQTAVAAATAAQKSAEEAAESAKEAAEGGGVQSDYTQNDPTAKDYIKNRPGGYEEGWEITWDGDTTGRVCVSITPGYSWYKVSDNILTVDQILGSQITLLYASGSPRDVTKTGDEAELCTITSDMVEESEDAIFVKSSLEIVLAIVKNPGEFVIMNGNFTITMPESGVYFLYASMDGQIAYISSLSKVSVYPFPDKYIPDTIATVEMVQNVSKLADTAKTTATTAKTTADSAKTTATTAITTATTAKTTADTAKTTADTAITTATTAKTTADTAKTIADSAYPRAGESVLRLQSNNSGISGNMFFSGKPNEPIYCHVDRSSASDAFAPARFVFVPNGGLSMQVEGINVLQMKSSSGKIFNITVDDSGTISATEVTS